MLTCKSFFFIALSTITLFACHKGDDKDAVYWGEATANKNNTPWVAKPYAVYVPFLYGNKDTFGINVEWFDDQGSRREILSFFRLSYKKGLYKVNLHNVTRQIYDITASYGTVQSGGDVQGDDYDLDTLANNTLEIVDFNKAKHEMTIKFDAAFVIKTRRVATSPERVVFKDGYVKTRVYNP